MDPLASKTGVPDRKFEPDDRRLELSKTEAATFRGPSREEEAGNSDSDDEESIEEKSLIEPLAEARLLIDPFVQDLLILNDLLDFEQKSSQFHAGVKNECYQELNQLYNEAADQFEAMKALTGGNPKSSETGKIVLVQDTMSRMTNLSKLLTEELVADKGVKPLAHAAFAGARMLRFLNSPALSEMIDATVKLEENHLIPVAAIRDTKILRALSNLDLVKIEKMPALIVLVSIELKLRKWMRMYRNFILEAQGCFLHAISSTGPVDDYATSLLTKVHFLEKVDTLICLLVEHLQYERLSRRFKEDELHYLLSTSLGHLPYPIQIQ